MQSYADGLFSQSPSYFVLQTGASNPASHYFLTEGPVDFNCIHEYQAVKIILLDLTATFPPDWLELCTLGELDATLNDRPNE